MTSERKIRANRENARASTGPQTATGKARASRNAVRHGLSHSVLEDPAWDYQIEYYGRQIAGETADRRLHELARRVAAAQVDVVRVRQARGVLQDSVANGASLHPEDRVESAEIELFAKKAKEFLALDRYERRAISRRKFATRALDELRREISTTAE